MWGHKPKRLPKKNNVAEVVRKNLKQRLPYVSVLHWLAHWVPELRSQLVVSTFSRPIKFTLHFFVNLWETRGSLVSHPLMSATSEQHFYIAERKEHHNVRDQPSHNQIVSELLASLDECFDSFVVQNWSFHIDNCKVNSMFFTMTREVHGSRGPFFSAV